MSCCLCPRFPKEDLRRDSLPSASITSNDTSNERNTLPQRSRNANIPASVKFRLPGKRPEVVTQAHPERQHFTNNYKSRNQGRNDANHDQQERPLILVVGDSTLKHVTSFDLRKNCRGANVMVRSIQGSKIKNIRNLIIDCLEDVTPTAICIHASTNDIGSGKSVEEIASEMKELVEMVQRQGILPIISLVTIRNDKHAEKVGLVNERLRVLCDTLGAGCIEHDSIRVEHLNTSGLHIARQFNYILNNDFTEYFNFAISKNFWFD